VQVLKVSKSTTCWIFQQKYGIGGIESTDRTRLLFFKITLRSEPQRFSVRNKPGTAENRLPNLPESAPGFITPPFFRQRQLSQRINFHPLPRFAGSSWPEPFFKCNPCHIAFIRPANLQGHFFSTAPIRKCPPRKKFQNVFFGVRVGESKSFANISAAFSTSSSRNAFLVWH